MPFAPGSFGTLAGLPVCWLLSRIDSRISFFLIALAIPVAVWIAGEAEKILEKKDPGTIVIDEILGMVLTLAGLPFNAATAGLGFVFFRVLDITKPFPIRLLERKFKGGTGIVFDDIAAGIIANITLRIILQLFDIK
jgi:phosphatidylglycerophosphatase A